ncbi:MAG: hypothetical protein QHC90_24815 [Shinella sp.]|nr:hypothetical protein [Shinella sp.]
MIDPLSSFMPPVPEEKRLHNPEKAGIPTYFMFRLRSCRHKLVNVARIDAAAAKCQLAVKATEQGQERQ